jgi:outer membrane protein assembly complex protein YaeT
MPRVWVGFLLAMAASAQTLDRDFILNKIRENLRPLGIELKASRFDYNVFRVSATLRDVVLTSTANPGLPPIFRADEVSINLGLRELLRGNILIQQGSVTNPFLHPIIARDGRDNLPRPEKTGDGETRFSVESLVLSNGRVEYQDARRDIFLNLPVWRAELYNQNVAFETRQPGVLRYEGRQTAVSNITGQFTYDFTENRASIRRLAIAAAGSNVVLSGDIGRVAQPVLNLKAEGRLAIGPATRLAGIQQDATGEVSVNANITGPPASLKVDAAVKGNNLAYREFKGVDLTSQLLYDAAANVLRADSFTVNAPFGAVAGNAAVALAPGGRSTLDARLRGVELLQLARRLDLPVRLASRASGTVRANWPGLEFRKAEGQAELELQATRELPARDVLPLSARLSAAYRADRLAVTIRSFRALAAQGWGTATLASLSRLGGTVNAGIPKIEAFIAQVNRFLGAAGPQQLNIEGPVELVADLGGTVENPRIDIRMNSAGLNIQQARQVALRADATYAGGRVTIREAVAEWRGQTLVAEGTLGVTGPTKPVDLRVRVVDAAIPALLNAFNIDVPAEGVLSGTVSIGGTLDAPRAEAVLTGRDLAAYGEPLGALAVEAALAGREVRVTRLRLEKPLGGTLTASGSYNLDTQAYSFDAHTDDFRLRQLVLPNGMAVRGELDLAASGRGTVSDPMAEVKLATRDLTVDGKEIGALTATASVAQQVAVVRAEAPRYDIAASARIGVSAPYPITFEASARVPDIGVLPVKLPVPIGGGANVTATGSGNLEQWKHGTATLRVEDLNLKWRDQPIRTEKPLVVRYDNRMFTVEPATIVIAGAPVRIAGQLPLEAAAGEGNLTIYGVFDLATLSALAPEMPPARGELALNALIQGSLEGLRPQAALILRNAGLELPGGLPPVTGANGTVALGDGRLWLDQLRAQWAGGTLTASGIVPLGILPANLPFDFPRRPGPAEFTADLVNVDFSAIEPLPDEIGGALSAHAELRAPRLALDAITGRITFPQLRVRTGEIELTPPQTPSIEIAGGVARFERFTLSGPESELAVSGTAALAEPRALNLALEGNVSAALVTVFAERVSAEGMAQFRLAVNGTMAEPRVSGFFELDQAQFALDTPDVLLEDLDLRLDIDGNRVTVARLNGFVNGGVTRGGGSFVIGGKGLLSSVDIFLNSENAYFNFPEGLKTVSNVALTARSQDDTIVIGGAVRIQEGTYTDDITIEGGLAQFLQSQRQGAEFTAQPNPLLARVRFDLEVVTESPLVIDNNLARLAADARLRLLGSWYQPGLTGRVQIEEGGEIILNERTYLIDRGIITFVNENRIEPSIDLLARTEASGYDITLQLTGEPGRIESTLSSDPPLGETDIIAVLLTGRTLESVRGEELNIAREQVFSYVAGRVGQTLSQQARRIGFTTLRLEPSLIAPEANPTARLTVGQEILRNFNLIYSLDLANAGNQIWIGEYDISKRFVTRGIKQEDNSYRFEFRHDLRFGGQPYSTAFQARRPQKEVGGVEFLGNVYFPDKKLADEFGVKAGDKYDFFKVRKGLERLREFYAGQEFLEARVRLTREERNGKVFLQLHIRPGRKVQFVYEGWNVPGDLRKRIRRTWQNGVFDAQRANEAIAAIRRALVDAGYVQGEVSWITSNPAANVKRVLFEIHPGVRYRDVRIEFTGVRAFDPKELAKALKDEKLEDSIYVNFRQVDEFLRNYYREQGYLDVEVGEPRFKLNAQARTGTVVIPVVEGPRYMTGNVAFKGNQAFSEKVLLGIISLTPKQPFLPALRAESFQQLQEFYWRNGYNEMTLEYAINPNPDTATVEVTFDITENQQRVVKEIEVVGTDHTNEKFVRGQMPIEPGQVLAYPEINEARSNLYSSGAFNVVDLEAKPLPRVDGLPPYQRPVRLVAKVNEVQPFRLLYGGYFDTERGPGGIVDFSNRNTLGDARVIGTRLRYDSDLHEARLYFSQPFLRTFPLRSSAVGYAQRELFEGFITDRLGATLDFETRFRERNVLTWGYRLERAHTFDRVPDPDFPFDVTQRIAPLTATFTREARDDLLDPTRGSFTAHAAEWGAALLGSQLRYLRYSGQYYHYFPLSDPVLIPWTRERQSRWVYATAVRVGLAGGLGGQVLTPSERFFAGGGTTIRGFRQDGVGPEVGGVAVGGNALFILNNEIRFPLYGIFDGVGFVDAGNVYPTVSDFDPTDLRTGVGLGLRVRTPYVLLRLDWGVNVSPRPGEPRSRWFFSIGQTF